eukprot:1564925-Alexandrium_andersonii.AAC.1
MHIHVHGHVHVHVHVHIYVLILIQKHVHVLVAPLCTHSDLTRVGCTGAACARHTRHEKGESGSASNTQTQAEQLGWRPAPQLKPYRHPTQDRPTGDAR